jgi:selenocysteine lyase/cysteine desulfurase
MESLGLEERGGAVRAGFLHYNTPAEVDRLCAAVEQIAALEPGRAREPRRDEAPA